MNNNSDLRNGTELLLTMMLVTELIDSYGAKRDIKRTANLFKNTFEKDLYVAYDRMHKEDESFTVNAMNKKAKCISQIASLNEADAILLYEFVDKFIKNIDIARKKGAVFFDKLQ